MSLTLVFRIQAVMFAIFGVMMLLAPGAMMASFNVTESAVAEGLMQGMSLMVLAMAYLSWQLPNWAADSIKSVGMFFCYCARNMDTVDIVPNEFRNVSSRYSKYYW